MGYETKVIMAAVLDIVASSKTIEEALERLSKIATSDSVMPLPVKIEDKGVKE